VLPLAAQIAPLRDSRFPIRNRWSDQAFNFSSSEVSLQIGIRSGLVPFSAPSREAPIVLEETTGSVREIGNPGGARSAQRGEPPGIEYQPRKEVRLDPLSSTNPALSKWAASPLCAFKRSADCTGGDYRLRKGNREPRRGAICAEKGNPQGSNISLEKK
jgi:hypothetical protein